MKKKHSLSLSVSPFPSLCLCCYAKVCNDGDDRDDDRGSVWQIEESSLLSLWFRSKLPERDPHHGGLATPRGQSSPTTHRQATHSDSHQGGV
uniref:Putative secreted peptide n=1 Tax=Anopheles braziliensis TaxID=58242 RepID=A0A2M3ZWQ6_9DIPT